MFTSYLRTALRHFRKHKLSTGINIVGLSIGISAALIIYMIITYDYSFDKFVPDGDRVYRVVSNGDGWSSQGVALPLATSIPNNGVERAATIIDFDTYSLTVTIPGTNKLFKKQEKVVFTDAGYFSIFPYKWLAGNPATALQQPNTVVLSESRARSYFPGTALQQIPGRTITFSDTINTLITGIVADQTHASDFSYASFISISTVLSTTLKTSFQADEWGSTNSANQLLVKLEPHVHPAIIEKQIAALYKEHIHDEYNKTTTHKLQPLSDIHINPEYAGPADPRTLRFLVLLALILLTLGAINFVNLSTAQAATRAREVGIRKTLGGLKRQLMTQFLTETFLLTLFATLLSIVLIPLLIKAFDDFIPSDLRPDMAISSWGFLLLLIVTVSGVAGIYPALVLTRYQPGTILKNKSPWLRKSLIVVQFVIAQVFLIGVLIVEKQIHYAVNKDMGFRKNAIINFHVPIDFANPNNKKYTLKKEIAKLAGVQQVSLGYQTPAFAGSMTTDVTYKDNKIGVSFRNGDTAYLHIYNIPIIAGRNLLPADTISELLINESLAHKMGFKHPADAVGQTLQYDDKPVMVAGVMRDFNQSSLYAYVTPLIYLHTPQYSHTLHIALQPDPTGWNRTIDQIQRTWNSIYPDIDFQYTFLDNQIAKLYDRERQLSRLLTWSAGVAMLISCLGILGLVIFMTNTRVKEIGVRKVLGATVAQIIFLLSADFAKLLAIAFLIAIPIAWWQASKWLQDFAYHTPLSWWLFGISGSIMIIIALLIVGIRAGKAALSNPVKSLRME